MPTEVAKVTDNFPPFVVSLSNPVLSRSKGMNRRTEQTSRPSTDSGRTVVRAGRGNLDRLVSVSLAHPKAA